MIDRTLDRKRALYRAFSYKIKHEQKRLTTLQTSYPLQFPERLYRPFIEKHIHLDERLRRSPKSIIERDEVQLERLTNRLKTMSPMYRVNEAAREISVLTNRLMTTSTHDLKQRQNRFSSTVRMLTSLNPLHVIERGYSIVYQDEKVQKSVEKLEVGSTVDIKMQDGTAKAMIKSIHKDDLEES